MTTRAFTELRDLVRHHGARRGWHSQRQIAVFCGLDETALSRFLNGEQDIGARRTHALFQALGVPVEQYNLAYALLGRAQEQAHAARERRTAEPALGVQPPGSTKTIYTDSSSRWRFEPETASFGPPNDLPASLLIARFAAGRFSGAAIAAFFAAEI